MSHPKTIVALSENKTKQKHIVCLCSPLPYYLPEQLTVDKYSLQSKFFHLTMLMRANTN